ncbi:TetR/AcrR family transcriptional regulator C-terminal domain-containing protein [Nocardioides sp. zg-1228]|uniref:TetR/AcrR family transcriptional regulator C-terminal domain-containing protein n=1 Tax=Nocardioides sp. zg-1228 TaxID=2763008 RepID=UPI001642C576|nr:TetR/AcrR family transcriptional regulator C-terminal domain-containing protein [Nocardioides sp. zg-1228]MBC2932992.1 TetR/AcrR family transcriptional regulator C-terminal domain-containing protein [Nocardioides sp. zg-1228]QSF56810.1 TetR/AcrR family transcriptional regulator C-terminal domain-containing protein [Nocardioides sp. zg-1228]
MPDSDPVLALLWRHRAPTPEETGPRRGPKQRVSVDDVVDAAIDLADRDGLAALSMRGLAQHLRLGAMTLYTYVPNRADLVVLMVDQVLGRTTLPEHPEDLRARLELVARVQYEDHRAHPWLLEVTGVRAWLGPHMADRYEWQLAAVEGIGLDDIEMDQTVTLLASFGTSIARAEQVVRQAERETGMTDAVWWAANHEALGQVMAGADYPLAGRVGTAAGETYQAASDPGRELEFGLARIVDGLLAHLADR